MLIIKFLEYHASTEFEIEEEKLVVEIFDTCVSKIIDFTLNIIAKTYARLSSSKSYYGDYV